MKPLERQYLRKRLGTLCLEYVGPYRKSSWTLGRETLY